ncbi:hypothetical protein [Pseudonocardia spirodelae]|uniref:Uncharacterized protein n=1 Tax=Pseudonocardia spirodelae TaxID=3133431 RepID=A0ABU8TBL8_9PSEU
MRERDERVRGYGRAGALAGVTAGAGATGTGTGGGGLRVAGGAAARAVPLGEPVPGSPAAAPSGAPAPPRAARVPAAERAARRWAPQGARERALAASVARHPAARARRAGAAGAGGPVRTEGPSGAPRAAALWTAPCAPASAPGAVRPARSVAVPPPRTVRPLERRCLVPPRPRRARARAGVRGRVERLLAGLAVALCTATVVVGLGLLGDAAAGWNAPSAGAPAVTVGH